MMISIRIFLAATALVPLLLSGQPEPGRSGPGGLDGVVLDAVTGSGIAEAKVALLEAPAMSARTDADGRFVMEGLPAGVYTLRVFKGGFAPCDIAGLVILHGAHQSARVALESRQAPKPAVLPPVQVNGEVDYQPNLAGFPARALALR